MSLIIKCSGTCLIPNGHPPVAAFGLTVRLRHRIIYRESGICDRGQGISARSARNVAVWRALTWLQLQPLPPGSVVVRFDQADGGGLPAAIAMLMANLREPGWKVWLQPVAPEYVCEAAALSRRAARANLREPEREEEVAVTTAPPLDQLQEGSASSSFHNGLDADLTVICDGGHKSLPGSLSIAAYGFVVWHYCRLAHRESGVVCRSPTASSQVAELGAVVAALRWLAASSLTQGARVEIRSDCQWVVHMLIRRRFGGARRGLTMLLRAAGRLLARLERNRCHVLLWQVPRALVAEADAMCWRVYGRQSAEAGSTYPIKSFLAAGGTGTDRKSVGQ